MKPETEAKAVIALIISLIAFGCGSGAGIVMGLSQNDTPNSTNLTNPQEIPQIQTTKNVNTHSEPQTPSASNNTNSESVYIENNKDSSNSNNSGNTNITQ
ncbi:hypothetical protein [Methanobacterium sp. ACI-7]|uniref:hypothetical protein n=1 Tax=unclassified Methanobacterium TaxID=2627676 RepID=UPI0039C47702